MPGACEGSVACSTCHVILPPEQYDLLPEPEDDENDMLDMAFGLTDTSRLGCQVKVTKELDGMTVTLPSATRNMFVDGASSHMFPFLVFSLCDRNQANAPLEMHIPSSNYRLYIVPGLRFRANLHPANLMKSYLPSRSDPCCPLPPRPLVSSIQHAQRSLSLGFCHLFLLVSGY